MTTNQELEDYLWKYGVKERIANIESTIHKGGAFFDSMSPQKSLQKKFDIESIIYKGNKVYSVLPKDIPYVDTIYYIHGGGFTCGLSKIQWDIIGYLASQLSYRIVVPDYPLVPHVNYKGIYEFIVDVYKHISYTKGRLFIVGDSAGASLILGLSQIIDKENLLKPNHLVLMSPWMDVTMTNPAIEAIQPIDPTLDVTGLHYIAKLYAVDDLKNPLVSPLYGDYTNTSPITLIIGTRDILYPDCKLFNEQCEEKEISLSYHEYKDRVHIFPLFDTQEGNEAKEIIIEALR